MHKRYIFCRSGSVLPLVALMFLLLLMAVGVVIDLGRLYAVEVKAQNASDAALLGAVATASTTDPGTEMVNLFNADYPANYMGSTVGNINVTQVSSGVYQATFSVTVPSVIMQLFGTPSTTLNILSQVTGGFQSSPGSLELALVLDNTDSMGEVVTGDTSGTTKIQALQQAATSLIDILFGSSDTLDNVHVSVIPYNIVVQIGTGRSSWMQTAVYETYNPLWQSCYNNSPSSPSYCTNLSSQNKYLNGLSEHMTPGQRGYAMNRNNDYLCGPYSFEYSYTNAATYCPSSGTINDCTGGGTNTETGQVTEPTCTVITCTPGALLYPASSGNGEGFSSTCVPNNLNDVDDTPPTAGPNYQFRVPNETQLYIDDTWGEDWTYPDTLAPLLFASNVKSDLINEINSLQNGGDTRIPVGLMWGWFTLSPKWQGLWDPSKATLPAPFSASLSKALVLMTDGVNDLDQESGQPIDDNETIALCNAIKAQGITIYTIGLGIPASGGSVNASQNYNPTLLQNCASMPTYFFQAPTAAQLQTVFHQIGDDVVYNTIHLSQ